MKRVNFREVAKTAARLAHTKHAEAIVALDVRRQTVLAEYFVIATVHSPAQMRAVQDSLIQHFRSQGVTLLRREGEPSARWMVLDYGGVVMHLLHPQVRRFYRLDQLWDGARHIAWRQGP
ncbi:MAG: ribosome silencing factor [Elusimicrobia bacterium]|nr:ribosome silencing factor [Elusimicrobiota bacterium]